MSDDELGAKAREAMRHLRSWIMRYGKMPSVRELMSEMHYKSPRSAMLLLEELENSNFLERKSDGSFRMVKDLDTGSNIRTVEIPLVGNITCGIPMLVEENIEAMIKVSTSLLKTGNKYFLLRAIGDSMNKADINTGDLMLIKQQSNAENGDRVVALIDDEATVKEYQRKGNIVALMPRSNNNKHKPIILEKEFQIQGIVVATIPNIKIY